MNSLMSTSVIRLKTFWIVFSLLVSVGVAWFVAPGSSIVMQRGLFIFCFAALLWIFELIPLFATSLLVVFLSTFLLTPASGKPFEYIALFSNPIIFLFFGGFVLAAVLHKYFVDEWVVNKIFKWFGTKPFFVLIGLIFATGFLSFWMSNTATTAIMLVTIKPILSSLDSKDPFRKAIALSVPFAANIGGIGTPIATPPNAIAVSLLAEQGVQIDFLRWMLMAVPLVIFLLLILAAVLSILFPARTKVIHCGLGERKANRQIWLVTGIAVLTIFLWLTSEWHRIAESHVAILSVTLFAVTGLLTKADLKRIDWDILILMWGGLALGKAMETSGLAEWVVSFPIFNQTGFVQIMIFTLLTVAVSAFMSNTAASNLILPLALSVGGEQMAILAVMVALASSFDMILPISTPPNAMAFATHEITSRDMLRSGSIVIAIAITLLLIGYPVFVQKILLGNL